MCFPLLSSSARLTPLLVIIGGALLATACGKKPPPAPPPPEVRYVVIQPQPVTLTTELPGRTSAFRVAEVRPQVGGVIQKRLFNEGAEVRTGQQLYQIDPAPYQASLDSAKASLKKAQASVVSSTALAQRYKPLAEARAVSKQELDNAVSSAAQAEADVASAKASVETARINLEYTRVLSPITGRTGRSMVTEGALVTANQATALVIVQQLDPIYVDVVQPTATLLRLQRKFASGQLKKSGNKSAEVKLTLEDGSAYTPTGTLQFSEVTVDQGTGSVILRAEFPNLDGMLLPGMFVHEQIEEGVNDSALLVPQQGITRNQRGDAVAMVLDANNQPGPPRKVTADRAIGDQWLVSDGLESGDKVVVQGQIAVTLAKPGTQVQAKEMTLDDLRKAVAEDEKKAQQGDGPGGDAGGSKPGTDAKSAAGAAAQGDNAQGKNGAKPGESDPSPPKH